MYVPVSQVSPIGMPLGSIVQGRSKTFSAPVTARTLQVQITLWSRGREMYLTLCQAVAPSIDADSYSSSEILLRPVSRMIK